MENQLKILYLGSTSGTSKHRADALVRLGHQVRIIDPWSLLPKIPFLGRWQYYTGSFGLEKYIHRAVLASLKEDRFDLVVVNCGELIGRELVKDLKGRFGLVVNYNNDDPFGTRDANRWKLYLKAVPEYDLVVVVREVNIQEAYAIGAKRVLRVFMSADEVVHKPLCLTEQDYTKWSNDVLFIGTWMTGRGEFMACLIQLGVPLSIYGDGWRKAPEWSVIKNAYRGQALYGDDYARAIQSAKICLGLLSKGNRDLHTTRSIEIPALGGLLCAERTPEHRQLYKEGEEAVFWKDAQECVAICRSLLIDEKRRQKISEQGKLRSQKNNLFNETVMHEIISTVIEWLGDNPKKYQN